jgi:uncharacterized protein (TIGR03083 family)
MPTERERRRTEALPLQTLIGERLVVTARSLRPEDWARPTNCPPWLVKTIVAHLVRNAEMFNVMLDTGLSGGQTFPQTNEERELRQKELGEMPNEALTEAFESSHRDLRDRLAGLSTAELEQPCPHPRWLMPASWIVDQRVVELAFHNWDLETSVGRESEIDNDVAQYILPAILENNLLLFRRSGVANPGSWSIHATGAPDATWLIRSSEDGATISRQADAADVAIKGDAAGLARWLYGRADLSELEAMGRVTVQGDRSRANSWRETFPSP